MTDHMKMTEEKPAQGCPFGHGGTPASREAHASHMAADEAEGWHNAQLDFSKSMSYGDYLSLGSILRAQHPLSPDHNEMLFIIQHQTSELWIKLMVDELQAVREQIRNRELPPAFEMLAGGARTMYQMVDCWGGRGGMTRPSRAVIRP